MCFRTCRLENMVSDTVNEFTQMPLVMTYKCMYTYLTIKSQYYLTSVNYKTEIPSDKILVRLLLDIPNYFLTFIVKENKYIDIRNRMHLIEYHIFVTL